MVELQKELQELGHESLAVPLDVTNTDEIYKAMSKINQHFSGIDILINNAGINITKKAENLTEEDWDTVLDLNLKASFFCTQAAKEYLIKSPSPKVINMSSTMGKVGYYERSAYSSSKGGVNQLTKALAIEWAKDGINVNAIGPTFVETELAKQTLDREDFRKDILERIPLGKLAKTEDLFGLVLYLSTPASNMVTGQTIYVDGGWTVW